MEQIKQIWEEFLKYSFPQSAHNNDLDLELLDSTIAGCVSSLVASEYLESKKMKILENGILALNENFTKIPKDAQEYFKKLLDIGEFILKNRANYIR